MNSSKTFSEFVLNCQHDNDQKVITSIVLAIAYLITVFGNGGVVLVILSDYRLQRPMYLYIIVLAMLDMIFCNIAIPRIIAILLSEARAVPSKVCAFQMYIFHYAETLESFILTLMAFDRYVAIVNPLRYPALVTNRTVYYSVLFANITCAILILPFVLVVATLPYCKTNILAYCFCDMTAMLRIACVSDDRYLISISSIIAICMFATFSIILFSYSKIIQTVLKVAAAEGEMKIGRKALGTCVSHMFVVCLYYFPCFIAYVVPANQNKTNVLAYSNMIMVSTIVPPLVNPMIYSFRNKEMKESIIKFIRRSKVYLGVSKF